MAKTILVDDEIKEGENLLRKLAHDGVDVPVAFWMKLIPDEDSPREGEWFLYIAMKLLDDQGPAAAYRVLLAAIRELKLSWIESYVVRAISPSSGLAVAVIDMRNKYFAANLRTRIRGIRLGDAFVDEALIYSDAGIQHPTASN